MMRYRVLALGCTLILVACGNIESSDISDTEADNAAEVLEPAPQSTELAEPAMPEVDVVDYVKPGAAVSFSHDYDGETDPGVRESFVLNLKPAYFSGILNLGLSTSAGLDLLVDAEQSFELSGSRIAVPVEIFAESAGVYRLNVSASVDTGSMMPSLRNQTVTINVGTQNLGTQADASQKANQSAPEISEDETPEGEAVISTRAEETIY